MSSSSSSSTCSSSSSSSSSSSIPRKGESGRQEESKGEKLEERRDDSKGEKRGERIDPTHLVRLSLFVNRHNSCRENIFECLPNLTCMNISTTIDGVVYVYVINRDQGTTLSKGVVPLRNDFDYLPLLGTPYEKYLYLGCPLFSNSFEDTPYIGDCWNFECSLPSKDHPRSLFRYDPQIAKAVLYLTPHNYLLASEELPELPPPDSSVFVFFLVDSK